MTYLLDSGKSTEVSVVQMTDFWAPRSGLVQQLIEGQMKIKVAL
jgi:hypothetical protein